MNGEGSALLAQAQLATAIVCIPKIAENASLWVYSTKIAIVPSKKKKKYFHIVPMSGVIVLDSADGRKPLHFYTFYCKLLLLYECLLLES